MKVLSFNLHRQKIGHRLFDLLGKEEIDIALLQEVDNTISADNLAKEYGFNLFANGELVILSRSMWEDASVTELPLMDLKFHSRRRIALRADFNNASGSFAIYNIQLDTRLNFYDRVKQLAPIIKNLSPICILGGDFNTVPFKFFLNMIPSGFEEQKDLLDNYFAKFDLKNTETIPGVTFRPMSWSLDAIYGRGIFIHNGGVLKNIKTSDHFPVWTELELRPVD